MSGAVTAPASSAGAWSDRVRAEHERRREIWDRRGTRYRPVGSPLQSNLFWEQSRNAALLPSQLLTFAGRAFEAPIVDFCAYKVEVALDPRVAPGLLQRVSNVFGLAMVEGPVFGCPSTCQQRAGEHKACGFFVHPLNCSALVIGAVEVACGKATGRLQVLLSSSRTCVVVLEGWPVGIKGGTDHPHPNREEPRKVDIWDVTEAGVSHSMRISSVDALCLYAPMVFFEPYALRIDDYAVGTIEGQEEAIRGGFLIRDLLPLTQDYYLPGFSVMLEGPKLAESLGISFLTFLEQYYCRLLGEAMGELLLRYGFVLINPSPQNFLFLLDPETMEPKKVVFRDLGDLWSVDSVTDVMREYDPLAEALRASGSRFHGDVLHLCLSHTVYPGCLTPKERKLSDDVWDCFQGVILNSFLKKISDLLHGDPVITQEILEGASFQSERREKDIEAIWSKRQQVWGFSCGCLSALQHQALERTGFGEWFATDALNSYFKSETGRRQLRAYYKCRLDNDR